MARSFSVSAGLRWEVSPPPASSDGRDAFRVNGDANDPGTLSVGPRGTPLWKTDWQAAGPRISAAWQPVQTAGRELILRGGLGVLFDTPNRAAAPAFPALGFTSTPALQNPSIPTTATAPPSPDVQGSAGLGYLFP